jgi:hypothetical protein
MILFFILPLIAILAMTLIHATSSLENLRLHWNEYRCNPAYMPFAEFIRPDVSVTENFNFCLNSFGSDIFSGIIDSISLMIKSLLSNLTELTQPLMGFRIVFSNIKKFILSFAIQVFGKISNSMGSVVHILIKIRDIMKRFVAEGYISAFFAISGINFIVGFVNLIIRLIKIFIWIMLAISFFLALFNLPLLIFVIIIASFISASGF